MFTVHFFFTAVISQRSSEDFPPEHNDFIVTKITGRFHTRCPPIYHSHKNIYRIAFYREISHLLSTNSRLTQNIYRILKLQGVCASLKIGFVLYSKIFTVYTPNFFSPLTNRIIKLK